ncbi:uncharacterized protein TM35_000181860 [Trypanosoma theileri]|uniref:Uncharacterized protein n=1 Tax=Trypanosoma theileri TaxID=67003 RepID=A0A1X0NV95_9TRYP|nr:uncharacterized protein TM35_000181860 [Trypanosoma theileri]ORC88129.1 hypothetical protein TM35_000181860 [Trypanosoma theileri]
MDEKTFTYIFPPAASAEECIRHVVDEKLPTLIEAITNAEGSRGVLLISRSEFISDALRSFACQKEIETYSSPGGGIIPTVVLPREREPSIPVPPIFDWDEWRFVWKQFVRDIPRESFLIENTPYDDAFIALDRIEDFLNNVYDDIPEGKRSLGVFGIDKLQEKGVIPTFFFTAWDKFRYLASSSEAVKRRGVEKAIRLAVLAAQQTILAFPVELLHAQFSRFHNQGTSEVTHAEEEVIYIGEPQENNGGKNETCDNPHAENKRMKVRIERRSNETQLPFVRVEKMLDAFTVDDTAKHSTKLRLQIAIEINFFSNDDVELTWEWRRPPMMEKEKESHHHETEPTFTPVE